MTNKDTWCVNAHINLETGTDGACRVCCLSDKKLTLNNKIAYLKDHSIIDIWNSPDRKELIEALDNGIKHENCKICWKEEENGHNSKRVRDNKTHYDLTAANYPKVLDLKLGNLCNIKCRTCSTFSSSYWAKEDYDLHFKNTNISFSEYTRPRAESANLSYHENNKNFWTDITTFIPEIIRFDIYGGEPMYIKKHWEILEKSIQLETSKNQEIHYNTNCTIFPADKIDILNQFKKVSIDVSLDGIKNRFEYIRHPANWNEVLNNLHQYINLEKQYPERYKISVCLTISAYNIYYIDETWDFFNSLGLNVYFNFVHHPLHMNLSIYPEEIKKLIIQKLDNFESLLNKECDNSLYNSAKRASMKSNKWSSLYKSVKNSLMKSNYDQTTLQTFWKTTKMHDEYRNESFEDTFPEMYKILSESEEFEEVLFEIKLEKRLEELRKRDPFIYT